MNKTPLILALCLFCSTYISANCSSPCCATGCYVDDETPCDCHCCDCEKICSCSCDSDSETTTQIDAGVAATTYFLLLTGIAYRQAICASITKATHSIAKKCAQAKDSAAPFIATAKEKGQQIIGKILNDERVKAAQILANAKIGQTRAYIKENPTKSALMTVGAGVVTYAAYKVAKALRRAYNCYRSIHNDFCICCGKKIGSRETKYATDKGLGLCQGMWQNYYCKNCHDHIEHDADNSLRERYKIRFGREFNLTITN